MPATDSFPEQPGISVCYFGTYESQYPRNRIFIKGLKAQNISVRECHVPLWELEEHKGASFGFSLGFLLRFKIAQIKLLIKYIFQPRPDVIMVGYIGHLDMFLAWFLSKISGAKLVFNPLVSLYDTVVADRGFTSKSSLKGKLLLWLDRKACSLSDMVILDTEAHIKYFQEALCLNKVHFERVWVGADDDIFKVSKEIEQDKSFNVLFVGKFIPLHGLYKIIDAIKLLENHPDVQFTIIGSGQLQDEIHGQAETLNLQNTKFIDHVPYDVLGEAMESAHLVLGIFGDSEKSKRVIPNKLYQALATGKAVLSADSPATRELLTDNKTSFLCQANAKDIARRILEIKEDPQLRLNVARGGSELFKESLSIKSLGLDLSKKLGVLVNG